MATDPRRGHPVFAPFFSERPPRRIAQAIGDEHLTSTLAALRACWEALDRAERAPMLFGDGDAADNSQAPTTAPVSGAAAMLATLDGLLDTTATTAGAELGRVTVAVYGLWIFEGLRRWIDPHSDWSMFEADMLGSIDKTNKGRKSQVTHCALHPIQIIEKYGNFENLGG
jgi:hypothetical protein